MQLHYVLDPMCSWCWAFRPSLQAVREQFPDLPVHYVLGGLAPDSDEPMPAEMQTHLQSIWQQIATRTGASFNYDFWTQCAPRRSTWRACRAMIVAEALQPDSCEQMLEAIQQAYYQQARNPSDRDTLIDLAHTLGLNTETFATVLDHPETQQALDQHMTLAQQLQAQGFPALRLEVGGKLYRISDGYVDADTLVQRLQEVINTVQEE